MLKVNDICEFKIIDTGINFEGISKTEDGLTVFIPDALKGEVVTAKIIKVNKSYALGNLLDIKQASGHRCKEDCEYYNICGGCSSRHTDYENTLEIKKANVINTLKKQDISDSFVKDIYGMGNPYYYRNKVQYPVRKYKGETIMGMFAKATHDIVQNRYCLIQDKIIDEVAKDLFDLVIKYHLEGYDESKGTGEVRNIMVRRGTHTGEIMCVLVLNNEKILQDERLDNIIKQITCKYHEIVSFVVNINTKITNVILTNSNMCVYGREYILDIIGDYIFKITADSFFQVNTIQAEVLYNVLKEKLELNKDKTLLELYSGVGSIGIFLSDSKEILKRNIKLEIK